MLAGLVGVGVGVGDFVEVWPLGLSKGEDGVIRGSVMGRASMCGEAIKLLRA